MNHMFYMAFENSICDDYATEKFYRSLLYPIVPVVMGGANYKVKYIEFVCLVDRSIGCL